MEPTQFSQSASHVEYRGSQTFWTMREDEVLCEAWSAVSQDTVTGANQTGTGMWRRIQTYFKAELPMNPADRTPDALSSRWKLIQKFLNKFNGILIAIEGTPPSGSTHDSRMQMARQTYQIEMKKAFAYEGCWLILHQCPKWNANFETKMATRRRRVTVAASSPASQDSPSPSTPTTPGTDGSGEVQQPEGSKKSKARKRKKSDGMELMQEFFKNVQACFNMDNNSESSNATLRREELEVAQMNAEAQAEKNRIKIYQTESRILLTNLDFLSGPAREAMRMKQEKIAKKWEQLYGSGDTGSGSV